MWLCGAIIATAGTVVYVELGTGLPRNGGEKNYLEFIYRRPKFMMTCVFSVYALITGSAAANSVVFGEYVIHSFDMTPNRWNTRSVAFLCLTFCLLAHGMMHKFGLCLQNALGFSKLLILFAIAVSGLFCLVGVPGFAVRDGYEKPRNFEWDKMWQGSRTNVNAFVMGMYSVIWSFTGYSNANYALSEVKDPIRTIKRAAPLAMFFVAMALSVFVALSVLGNLLSGQFAQGRVSSYSSTIINTLVAIGLFLLYTPAYRIWGWNPPFHAPKTIIVLFFFSNLFLVVVPLIPPSNGLGVYEHLPYWLHVFVAYLVSLIGMGYWYARCVWIPRRKGYRLERQWVLQEDGVPRFVFEEVPQ
ncbi:hypothetical protein C0995_015235 [Termitomyces sp. Mi166|nr:hypothetical protein C0995_015235 [Termitomyces sp. Mi166\